MPYKNFHNTLVKMTSIAAAEKLWTGNGLPSAALSRLVLSKNPDPAINSSFKLGAIAQTSIGLSGLAAAHFYELRTGVQQTVSVNARHAVLEFSEYYIPEPRSSKADPYIQMTFRKRSLVYFERRTCRCK